MTSDIYALDAPHPEGKPMTWTLTITLRQLQQAKACTASYRHLVKALGGMSFGQDTPINLLRILEINGYDDCLWTLRVMGEDADPVWAEYERVTAPALAEYRRVAAASLKVILGGQS
jgi:hypothetical protein